MGRCRCHGRGACAEDVSVLWSELSSGSCAHASLPRHRHSGASPTTHRTWGSSAVPCRSLAGDTGHKPGDPTSSGSQRVSAAHCPLHLPGRPHSHSQRGGWGRGRGRGWGTGAGRGGAGGGAAPAGRGLSRPAEGRLLPAQPRTPMSAGPPAVASRVSCWDSGSSGRTVAGFRLSWEDNKSD